MARRMLTVAAIPGQRLVVEDLPEAWPYRVRIGDETLSGWPERYTSARNATRVRVSFTVPKLGKGAHRLEIHHRDGVEHVGTVTIR